MAKTFSLEVVSNDDEQPFESGATERSLQRLNNYIKSCVGGARNGAVTMSARNDSVAASGTITLATCLTGHVIRINNVPFTAISGTRIPGNDEFNISGDDTADAVSLAAAINASTTTGVADVVTATSALGVVTVTSKRKGVLGNGLTLENRGVVARAVVTPTTVSANDTVTVNGTAMTGKQLRATGTLTAATAIAGTSFTLRGHTFTGAAGAATPGAATFSIDTGDNATATSIAFQINAYAPLSGIVTATSTGSSGVVTIRAVTAGTAGNAITLTGTATVLAASGSGTLSGGIAVANNEWDITGNDMQDAVDLARAINASTTAGVNLNVRALANCSATVIASSVDAGDAFTIYVAGSYYTFTAVAGAAALGTLNFSKDTGDNETATSIGAQVNAYTALSGLVSATVSTATVTLRPLTTAAAQTFSLFTNDTTDLAVATAAKGAVNILAKVPGTQGNTITIATIDGTRLPITSSLARLGGGTQASYEGAAATGTLTLTSWLNAQTVAVNGVTITAHTNTQANDQVDISGADSVDATNLALAINNSTTAGLKEVFATASSNVVTVTARRGGLLGNLITLSSGQGSVVANVANLAGGALPTTVVLSGDRLASGAETLMTFTF